MTKKSKFLHAGMITLSLLLAAPASAEDGPNALSMKPTGAWSVTRTGEGASGYCAMSRGYDGGITLSVAENGLKEYSLALEFKGQPIEAGKPYTVNVQAGGGQFRSLQEKSTSQGVLVLSLGGDDRFITGLAEEKSLKVTLDDSASYLFSLTDFADGMQQVEACLGGQEIAKAEAPAVKPSLPSAASLEPEPLADKEPVNLTDAMPPADDLKPADMGTPVREIASVMAEDPQLAAEEVLKEEGRADSGAFAVKKASNAAAAPEDAAEAAQKIARVDPNDKPPHDDVAEAVKNDAPFTSAASTPRAPESGADVVSAQQDVKELQRKIDMLQQQNQALKEQPTTNEQIQKLQAAIKTLEGERTKLQVELASAEFNSRNVPAEGQEMTTRARELESQLTKARDENALLAKQISEMRTNREDMTLSTVAGDWDLEKAMNRFNEAEREIRRLGLLLEQERMNCNREKTELEGMLFDPAVADKEQIQHLNAMEMELKDAQAKIGQSDALCMAKVGQETAALQAQVREAENKAMQADAEAAAKGQQAEASVKEEIAAMGAKIASLEQELAAAKATKEKEVAAAVASNGQVIAGWEKEKLTLEARLRDSEKKIALFNQERTRMNGVRQKEREELIGKIALLEQAQADKGRQGQQQGAPQDRKMEEQAAKIEALAKENAAKAAQIETLTTDLSARSDKITALNQDLIQRTTQLSLAKNEAQTVKADETQLGEMQKKIQALEGQISVLNAQKEALSEQGAIKMQEAENLRVHLAETQMSSKNQPDKIAALQIEIENLRTQIALKDNRIRAHESAESLQQAKPVSAAGSNTIPVAAAPVPPPVAAAKPASPDPIPASPNSEAPPPPAMAAIAPAAALQPVPSMKAAKIAAPVVPPATRISSAPDSVQPQSIAPQPVSIQRQGGTGVQKSVFDRRELLSLLDQAGAAAQGGVAGIEDAPASGGKAYRWKAAEMDGSAEVKPILSNAEFMPMVDEYIQTAKSRCNGDFASVPTVKTPYAGREAVAYDMACVTSSGDITASVLFFSKDNDFIAIAHEGTTESMDKAMNIRERLTNAITGGISKTN